MNKRNFADWLAANATPVQLPLSAVQIQVYGIRSWDDEEAGFVRDFLSVVRGMNGVMRCETETVDAAADCATFRIFYNRNAIPEGIIPAIESAHAVAHARKLVPTMGKDQAVVINISGRGDKDCAAIARYRGEELHH